jgi:hypothetical protein
MENQRHSYLAPLWAKFNGVRNEVDQNLNHPALVTQDLFVVVALNSTSGLLKH